MKYEYNGPSSTDSGTLEVMWGDNFPIEMNYGIMGKW